MATSQYNHLKKITDITNGPPNTNNTNNELNNETINNSSPVHKRSGRQVTWPVSQGYSIEVPMPYKIQQCKIIFIKVTTSGF